MAVEISNRMTVQKFDEWVLLPENDQQIYEYVRGEALPMVSNHYASYVAARFLIKMGAFVESNQLGYVTGADGGYKVGEERYIPDVGFISIKRQAEPSYDVYNPLAPDLVVEVVSPTDRASILQVKISNYLAAGTTVWVVYPEEKTVYIHRPGQSVDIVREAGTIKNEPKFPGFELKLSDIFPKEA